VKKSPKKSRPFDKNRSPVGWYVATYVERFEWEGEDRSNLKRRCNAWRNAILVRAKTPEEAYTRSIRLAKLGDTPWHDAKGRKGRLLFEGLISLLPIHDELEDGAELIWWRHDNVAVESVKKMVKSKKNLEAFREG
jgi:hypothetical protein